MKYFKKYPLFYIVMFVLLAAFVGGTAYDFMLLSNKNATRKSLNKAMKEYKVALDNDPTQKAIDDSSANIKALDSHLDILEKELTRAEIFKKQTATEGYQLVEELRGIVNDWRKKAKSLDIDVDPSMDFSFKKYVAPGADPMPKEAVAPIWKQVCVLDYIMNKLFACKSEKSPMGIVNIQRELLPGETVSKQTTKRRTARKTAKSSASTALKGDNFVIDPAVTARKEGSLRTIAFRFIFTGHTDVLRRFLNQLKDFDAMLVVRSIDVKPAERVSRGGAGAGAFTFAPDANAAGGTAGNANMAFVMPTDEQLAGSANPQNADAGAAANPEDGAQQVSSENRTPVVTDNISEFSVVIEYVEVVKDDVAKAQKADVNGGEAEQKK